MGNAESDALIVGAAGLTAEHFTRALNRARTLIREGDPVGSRETARQLIALEPLLFGLGKWIEEHIRRYRTIPGPRVRGRGRGQGRGWVAAHGSAVVRRHCGEVP